MWEEGRSPSGGHCPPSCVSVCPGRSATTAPTLPTVGAGEGSGRGGEGGERRRVFPASSFCSAPSLRRDPAPSAPMHPIGPAPIRPFPGRPRQMPHSLAGNRLPGPAQGRSVPGGRPSAPILATAPPGKGALGYGPQGAPRTPLPTVATPLLLGSRRTSVAAAPLTFVVSWWGEALGARAAGALQAQETAEPGSPAVSARAHRASERFAQSWSRPRPRARPSPPTPTLRPGPPFPPPLRTRPQAGAAERKPSHWLQKVKPFPRGSRAAGPGAPEGWGSGSHRGGRPGALRAGGAVGS